MRKFTYKWVIGCSVAAVLSWSTTCFGEGSENAYIGRSFSSTVNDVKWKVGYSQNVRDEITYAEIYGSSSQEYGDVSVPDVLSFDSGGSAGMRYAHPTVLRAGAFRGLQTLRTVSIPLTYKTINVPAFWGCTNLRAINVSPGCPNDSSVDGVLFDKKRKILKKYPEGKVASSYAVPSTVTELAEGCFAYAPMTTISFAGDAPLCGEDVFYGAQPSLALLYPQSAKGWTKTWNGVPTYAIPNAVSNLKASNGASPSSVEVTWSGNAAATSYKVYRATSGSAEKILLGTVWGATRYVDTSVVSGTRYYYSIVPVNGPAEGQSSQAVEGWAQQIKVTVHFNGNGGSLDEYQVVYTEGLPYGSFPGVTCPGRTFRGWYTAPLGGTKVETSDVASSAITTLYAQWREVTSGDFDCYIPMIPDTEIVILRYNGSDSRVTVPDILAGCKVVAVDDEAFANCCDLESVTLPADLRSIGYYAFKGCTSLISIQLPQSVKSICTGAFCDCISLHSIELPERLEIFGAAVFRGCESLESLAIPEGVDEVPSSLCKGCQSLESVIIPSTVKTIGDEAFHDCSCLRLIELPNGLESIEHTAFYGCFNLKELLIPSGVTCIGEYAFYDCASLTSIEIPAALTEIRPGAFGGCRALTSVNVPQGVKSIGDYAFYECDRLQTVHLPEGLTSIDSGVFSSCWNLENVVLPESLTSIGTWAFSTCCNCLKEIRIPAKVESIGQWAFTGCLSLSAVNVDSGNVHFKPKFGSWMTRIAV